jgi:hypothetical protein
MTGRWGRFPLVALTTALGLCVCSLADALSRATLNPSLWLLWAGLALIVAPNVYRLCSLSPSVTERAALVCLFGLALCAVKVMRDPFGYTLPDEFFHAHNAQQIVLTHKLFVQDTMLPVSTKYPGLEGATSALMFLTGMSSVGAGTIVIATAQLVLMLALFVLFMAVSSSPRVAGLGAVAYAGNSNFLFFGNMFAYESLALPLFVVILAMVSLRVNAAGYSRRVLPLSIVALTLAVAVTHHLTSYLLDLVLAALAVMPLLSRGRMRPVAVKRFALWSIAVTGAWLVVVASETVGYITPVIDGAFVQTLATLRGESSARVPFSPGPGGVATPLDQKITSFVALAILFVALPFGLRQMWRRHRRDPIAVLLGLGGLGYFGFLGLRLAPSAWEVASRADEFLFIGLGLVVAYAAAAWIKRSERRPWLPRALIAVSASVVVVGGAITGFPVNVILTPPTVIRASGADIPSQTLAVGLWARRYLHGGGFAAPDADARVLILDTSAKVRSGDTAYIDQLLTTPTLPGTGPLHAWQRLGLRYAVVDRRARSTNNSSGYGFSVRPPGGQVDQMLPLGVATQYDDLPAARVYDSGDIDIYDLKGDE